MKIHWKKVFYFVFLLGSMFGFKNAVGQNDSIHKSQNLNIESTFYISGKIFETDNKTPIPFCNIELEDKKYNRIISVTSNFDGRYIINNLPEGTYSIKAYFVGFNPVHNNNFILNENTYLDFSLKSTVDYVNSEVIHVLIRLINPWNTQSGETIRSEDIKNMPIRR